MIDCCAWCERSDRTVAKERRLRVRLARNLLTARESLKKAKNEAASHQISCNFVLSTSIVSYLYFFAVLFKSFVRDFQRFVRGKTLNPEADYPADVDRSAPALGCEELPLK
jgi:hypothetical protein